MTYYSETLQSPVSADYVKSQYGISPVNEPGRLAGLGFYPLVECDPGYTPARYEKQGDRYQAVPMPISNEEMATVAVLRQHKVDAHKLKQLVVPPWSADDTYAAGDEVQHQGKFYRKADDSDTSPPDDVPGGWVAA